MEIYKTIYIESYESLYEHLETYIKRLYKIVWVDVIYGVQYTYIITCRRDIEPDVQAIPNNQFEEWWLDYSPLPCIGEVFVQTIRDTQGYVTSLSMSVLGEPDDFDEEVIMS